MRTSTPPKPLKDNATPAEVAAKIIEMKRHLRNLKDRSKRETFNSVVGGNYVPPVQPLDPLIQSYKLHRNYVAALKYYLYTRGPDDPLILLITRAVEQSTIAAPAAATTPAAPIEAATATTTSAATATATTTSTTATTAATEV
jgi:hypothetical protein